MRHMNTERQQAIGDQPESGKPPDNSAARVLKWCKEFAGSAMGVISPKKDGQKEVPQGSEDRVGADLDRIRGAWDRALADANQEATDQTKEGRRLGIPDVIREFDSIGIRLSYRDDGTYSDWCVFPDPASTSVVVSSSYKKGLEGITTKQMAAIKFALGSGLFTKSHLIFALIRGEPSFDDLVQRTINNIPKL